MRKIADEVAEGVFKELDYHNEAHNAELFLKKHQFLPFVTAPKWLPQFTGPKGTARVLQLGCESNPERDIFVLQTISNHFRPICQHLNSISTLYQVLRTLEWIHGRKLQEIESEEERMKMVDSWISNSLLRALKILKHSNMTAHPKHVQRCSKYSYWHLIRFDFSI